MRAVLAFAMLSIGCMQASAEDACRFVDVADPTFVVSFDPGTIPVVTMNGRSEKWTSETLGTGISAMRAIDPANPEGDGYVFATHDYDGKTFLVFGSNLLVETCGK